MGTPGTPAISSPTDFQDVKATLANKVTISWANTAKAGGYEVQLWKSVNPAGISFAYAGGALSNGTSTTKANAFDTNTTGTAWISNQTGTGISGVSWIGNDLGATTSAWRAIDKVVLKHYSTGAFTITSAKVQFSDDLVTWTDLQTITIVKDGSSQTFSLTNSTEHRAWRLLANANVAAGLNWRVSDLEFMISGAVTPSNVVGTLSPYTFTAASREYTVRVRAANTICPPTVYSNWSRPISFYVSSPVQGTVYLDSNNVAVLSGGVCTGPTTPINSSGGDLATSAQAIGSTQFNTTTASYGKAFDNSTTTWWAPSTTGNGAINAWIGQNFGTASGSAKHIRKVSIQQYASATNSVGQFAVEFSDDGSSWTTVNTIATPKNGNLYTYLIDSTAPHQYWRIRSTQAVTAGYYWAIRELEFRELSGGDIGTLQISGKDWQNFSETGSVDNNGVYNISLPYSTTGTNQVNLTIESGEFICSCPTGCVYGGVASPKAGLNFYVTDAQHPWYQVTGGSVLAYQNSGAAVVDPIPTLCVLPACKPYLITQSNGSNTSGYVLSGGGTVDLRYAAGQQDDLVDEDAQNRIGTVTSHAAQERYEYFTRLYKFPVTPVDDYPDSSNDALQPTAEPKNAGVAAYYHKGDMTIQTAWNVGAGESKVIFVDGNLTLKNETHVAIGGFLAFIVKGDITFDSSLGQSDETSTTPVVEGMYVANGQLVFPSAGIAAGGDKKFVGAGTFVGWNGISMGRDYDDGVFRRLLNNTNPTEAFFYRPDLVLNTPQAMRTPRYQWSEVSP